MHPGVNVATSGERTITTGLFGLLFPLQFTDKNENHINLQFMALQKKIIRIEQESTLE
jgi:hypothetical protein